MTTCKVCLREGLSEKAIDGYCVPCFDEAEERAFVASLSDYEREYFGSNLAPAH